MDNKEYLNQIAAETRSGTAQQKKSLFGGAVSLSPTMIKVLIGGVVLVIVMMIVGAILGSGNGNKERDLVDRISLRTASLISAIGTYNKQVKSSQLRSMGTSLSAVLTETNFAVNTIIKEDFEGKDSKAENETVQTEEAAMAAELNTTLESGRLNGILDRVYAREMTYQIGMLISLEQETDNKTKKENLKNTLGNSINNLGQLYNQFGTFSAE